MTAAAAGYFPPWLAATKVNGIQQRRCRSSLRSPERGARAVSPRPLSGYEVEAGINPRGDALGRISDALGHADELPPAGEADRE